MLMPDKFTLCLCKLYVLPVERTEDCRDARLIDQRARLVKIYVRMEAHRLLRLQRHNVKLSAKRPSRKFKLARSRPGRLCAPTACYLAVSTESFADQSGRLFLRIDRSD